MFRTRAITYYTDREGAQHHAVTLLTSPMPECEMRWRMGIQMHLALNGYELVRIELARHDEPGKPRLRAVG